MAFSVGTLTGYVKANERELLTKSLFSAKSISLASKMPNVKSSSQLNLMDTDAVFQSGVSCGFVASGTTTFTRRNMTVSPIKVHESLCPKTLENTWLGLVLPSGSNPKSIPFEQQFTDLKAGLIAQNLERAFWQGDTGSGDNALAQFDGMIKLVTSVSGSAIAANSSAFMSGAPYSATGGITTSNVIAILQGVFRAIPAALVDKTDTTIFVGIDTFRTYQLALTNANLFHYNTDGSSSNFEIVMPGTNIKVVGVNGLNGTNRIYALRTSNMFFGCDVLGEESKFELFWAQEAMEVRYVCEFKAGVQIAFPAEIVYFVGAA
jgi:hypothetical protein